MNSKMANGIGWAVVVAVLVICLWTGLMAPIDLVYGFVIPFSIFGVYRFVRNLRLRRYEKEIQRRMQSN